jgi:hypothetical protein
MTTIYFTLRFYLLDIDLPDHPLSDFHLTIVVIPIMVLDSVSHLFYLPALSLTTLPFSCTLMEFYLPALSLTTLEPLGA